MAAFFADENFSLDVVRQLRLLGHDVTTVADAKMFGADDPAILAFATSAGRAVLTLNRRHFIRLHLQGGTHAGLVVCTHDDPFALATRIHQAVQNLSSLTNRLLRINRPP